MRSPAWLARLWGDPVRRRRVGRYLATSLAATAVSEATLIVLYGANLLDAAGAAVVANLAGTVPSYLMSRYWIWPEADRRHAGRQVGSYWIVSLVSLALSSAVTGVVGAQAPGGRGLRTAVVGLAYVATYAALWVAKFVTYQRIVFPVRRLVPVGEQVEASGPACPVGGGESLPRSA